jgi:ribosomal protein L37AE/L43A
MSSDMKWTPDWDLHPVCPDCGRVMKKRANQMKWECVNSKCSVISIETPSNSDYPVLQIHRGIR